MMDRKEIEKKVNEIIVDKLGVGESDIRPSAKMNEDLNADSLDAIELTMEMEKEFEIRISDEQVYAMKEWTIADIYNCIEEYLNNK